MPSTGTATSKQTTEKPTAIRQSQKNSSSASAVGNSTGHVSPSRKDLASLQRFLDRDIQSFWDIRKFGRSFGCRIICPCCGIEPPIQQWRAEDYEAYGHRKWRWLTNHVVTVHARAQATTFRHREAIKQKAASVSETRFAGKRTRIA